MGPSRPVALLVALLPAGCAREPALPEPGSYELHPELEMRLWAAEPDVLDPVAIAWDAAERAYVVEMRDYPAGMPPGGGPGGRVRLLEDRDRDGRADRSTVFADGLSFPTSVAPWRGGVFVTAPPQILYLADTDDDGRADLREVVFDGFTLGVTDSNVNGLRWAIDNRIHGANGGNGGHVRSGGGARESAALRAGDAPELEVDSLAPPDVGTSPPWTSVRGLDFRFDPRTRELEPTYHTAGGFGLAFDEWGRSFSPYNIDHLQQRVLPVRYLDRSPALPPLRGTANISVHGGMARIFPISVAVTRPNHPEQAGHYSAAGGIGYLAFVDEGLPRGVLVCDVVGNLVSREVLRLLGPAYTAERAPEERDREFLRSRDPSFRPVAVEMGPDGALYVLDMQRAVIEHPDYIPEEMRRTVDVRAGADRGRVYRVLPRRGLPAVGPPLDGLPSAMLASELASPLRWRRDTAQRLLYERGDAPLARLRAMAAGGAGGRIAAGAAGVSEPAGGAHELRRRRRTAEGGPRPGDADESAAVGRAHALWALAGAGAADEEVVLAALEDPEAGVRENALQIAEPLLRGSAALAERVIALAEDPSARVRFQAALTLGELEHPHRTDALLAILWRDADHRFTRAAVESALDQEGAQRALLVVLEPGRRSAADEALAGELAELAGGGLAADGAARLETMLDAALAPEVAPALAAAALGGLASGLARAGDPPPATTRSARLLDDAMRDRPSALGAPAWRVRRASGLADGPEQSAALDRAVLRAGDSALAIEERAGAVDLLALGRWERVGDALVDLLEGGVPGALQARAVGALESFADPALGRGLTARLRRLAPGARQQALRLLLRRPAFHGDLVAALEEGRLTAGELHLDLEQRRRLLRSEATGVAARAAALIDDHEYGGREAVVAEWLAMLPAVGAPARGRALHQRLCAQCHRADGSGSAADGAGSAGVGPDLSSLAHRSVEDLVSNILDPDMAIPPRYAAYALSLSSGVREIGVIESETAAGLVLLQAGGLRREIARSEIVALESTGSSLMPTGLEQGLTPQDLRDLVAFIQRR